MKLNMWYFCLILAFVIFFGTILFCIIRYRISRSRNKNGKGDNKGRPVSAVTLLIIATFFASLCLLFPTIWESVSISESGFMAGWHTSLASLREALQVFSLDGEYINDLYEAMDAAKLQPFFYECYRFLGSLLYVAAPILLVGIIISVFRNISARTRLRLTRKNKVYLFSELNSKSLTLAESILADEQGKKKQPLIVFTDVYNKNDEESNDLQTRAKNIGAICTETDILELGMDFSKKKWQPEKNAAERPVNFFILGSDQTENIDHASKLIDKYEEYDNISLYILAESEEEQTLISATIDSNEKDRNTENNVAETSEDETNDTDTKNKHIQLRFINPAQSLVYNYLYDVEGNHIFNHMKTLENGEEVLSIVVVGLGNYGLEFLRSFLWYTQVRGVRLQAHVYDKDPLAEQKFASLCPEVMKLNHQPVPDEVSYDIWFESAEEGKGIDADTVDFDNNIASLPFISAAYVTLGDDDADIRIAIKLRRLIERYKKYACEADRPMIISVVFDPVKNKMAKKTDYNINFIGGLEDTWSKTVIISPQLERDAEENHVKWADTESDLQKEAAAKKKFYQDNYNYKSSTAKTIREKVQINNPKIKETYLDSEESRRLENNGWNAYMRSEGFCKSDEYDDKKISLKLHGKIVPYDELKNDKDKWKNSYKIKKKDTDEG